MRGAKVVTPLWAREDGTTCSSLKHFFRCDGTQGGYLVDTKGGVVAAPQTGYAFTYDSATNSVKSTAPQNAAREELVSGSFEALLESKYALLMHAGYLDSYPGETEKTLRLAIGDTEAKMGWGMSDGAGATNAEAHVILNTPPGGAGYASGSYWNSSPASSLGDYIDSQIGQGGYFYRYAFYRPDASLMESKVCNGTTGAALVENDTLYSASSIIPGVTFDTKFRMHGFKATGIALFYFDAEPSDLSTAIQWMAAEWKRNNRVIWPYWD